jgi:hypothetical protein
MQTQEGLPLVEGLTAKRRRNSYTHMQSVRYMGRSYSSVTYASPHLPGCSYCRNYKRFMSQLVTKVRWCYTAADARRCSVIRHVHVKRPFMGRVSLLSLRLPPARCVTYLPELLRHCNLVSYGMTLQLVSCLCYTACAHTEHWALHGEVTLPSPTPPARCLSNYLQNHVHVNTSISYNR